MRVIRERNVICSTKFLDALIKHHGAAEEEPEVVEVEEAPEPEVVLPPIPNELIAAASHDLSSEFEGISVQVRDIQVAVCKEFGIALVDLLSHRRTKNVMIPRHVAVYLCRKLTQMSLPYIGRRFSGRDHGTLLSSVRRAEVLMERDHALKQRVYGLTLRLGGYIE
jgi:chromosomal replication initiator protein